MSAALVVLLVALAIVWWVGRQAVLQVTTTTGIPDCRGTTPTTAEWKMGSGFKGTAIPLREGFVCAVMVRINNDSGRELDLGKAVVGGGGQRSGAGYKVTHLGNYEVFEGSETNAVVDLQETISPHSSRYVGFRIVFRKGSCNSPGEVTITQPSIRVHHLLASRELRIADFPLFVGTPDGGSCDT